MKKSIFFLSAGILFAGCAGPTYYKKGATQEQFTKDKYDCAQLAGSTANANPFIYNSVMKDCMVNKHGYSTEKPD